MTNRTATAEAAAFRALVAPHLVEMGQLASRLTAAAERDDVIDASLATAWRRRGEYDESQRSARAWLLAIVADRCRRHRPREGVTSELVDLPAAATIGDTWRDLDAALISLPWEQRLAMELFYLLGFTASECAAVLGCDDAAVSATVAAARQRLLDGVEEIELS